MKNFNLLPKAAFVLVGILLGSMSIPYQAQAQTATAPFQITSCLDLKNIQNNLAGNYQLANDIDCSNTTFEPLGSTVYPYSTPFTGTLSGLSADGQIVYKIKNLTIINSQANGNAALFGSMMGANAQNPASIHDLVFTNLNIQGGSQGDVAALTLGTQGNASINNVTIDETIGAASVNSPVSHIAGAILNIGDNTTLTDKVQNVSVNMRVQGDALNFVSGFVFGNFGSINQSSAHVAINTQGEATGFALQNNGTISNSYATGSIAAVNSADGFAGINSGTISNSYAAVRVSGNSGPGPQVTAGFLGIQGQAGIVTNSFWDMDVSGQTFSAAGTGEHTAQMFQESTYNSWDFTSVWDQYPHLRKVTSSVASNVSLTVIETSGSGLGSVSSSPAGINCATVASCQASFTPGTQVTLTENNDWGSNFGGWQGVTCNEKTQSGSTCTFTINSNTTVSVSFAQNTGTLVAQAEAAIDNYFSVLLSGADPTAAQNAMSTAMQAVDPADQSTVAAYYNTSSVKTAEAAIDNYFKVLSSGQDPTNAQAIMGMAMKAVDPADQSTVAAHYNSSSVTTAEAAINNYFAALSSGQDPTNAQAIMGMAMKVVDPADQSTVATYYNTSSVKTAETAIDNYFKTLSSGQDPTNAQAIMGMAMKAVDPADQSTVAAYYNASSVTTAEAAINNYFVALSSGQDTTNTQAIMSATMKAVDPADQQTVENYYNQKLQASKVSADGTTLNAGSSGSLVTSAGTWTFSSGANSYGNYIMLNGNYAAGGSGVMMLVYNQGQVYVKNSSGDWYQWTGASTGWKGLSGDPRTPSTPSLTPDGTTLNAGSSGSLVTSAGTWTFSSGANSYGNYIMLNGNYAAGGSGVMMLVYNQGQVYVKNSSGDWYQWTGASTGWKGLSGDPRAVLNGAHMLLSHIVLSHKL